MGDFSFKQFHICQDRTAMKVGTDGVLLGAWAEGGTRVLDIGTGTGVIALMMAQRFPASSVTALDIDADAVRQARETVDASPFRGQVTVCQTDFLRWSGEGAFDSIVSNPPYFIDSLTSPDARRSLARHAASLPYDQLLRKCYDLLTADGEVSVVVPFDCRSRMESAAALAGLVLTRLCAVRTTSRKPPRRYLLAFRKSVATNLPLTEAELVIDSAEFRELLRDFYLKF